MSDVDEKGRLSVSKQNTHAYVAALMIGTATWLGSFSLHAEGNEGNDLEEMRKDIKQLKAQVHALRSALSEAAELDRQRAAIFSKLPKLGQAPAPEPAAASSSARNDEPPPAPRMGGNPRAPSLPVPRHAAEVTTGMVRGKVELPEGEPVGYVYVENVFAPPVKSEKVVIEQVRKQFLPSWAVIQRGTTVEFPNNDKIYHNVFSPSTGNSFDLGLYNSTSSAKTHQFNDPGSVDIFCNIHPQMAASILVVPNRYFAKVKPDGAFEIADVPNGKRKIVAWSPGSKLGVQWVDLSAGAVADVGFKLETRVAGHKNKNGQAYGSYQ
jgi:plastocyanin